MFHNTPILIIYLIESIRKYAQICQILQVENLLATKTACSIYVHFQKKAVAILAQFCPNQNDLYTVGYSHSECLLCEFRYFPSSHSKQSCQSSPQHFKPAILNKIVPSLFEYHSLSEISLSRSSIFFTKWVRTRLVKKLACFI